MTNPADPGGPYRPAEPGRPSRPGPPGGQGPSPYGAPPPRRPAPGPAPGTRQPPGHQATGPQQPPVWGQPPDPSGGAPRPAPETKGLLGALFDFNFNHLASLKLIKLLYVVALLLISLQCVILLGLGAWVATWDDFWAWGVILVVSTPLVWIFELLLTRIFMESVVVRYKGVDHLRIIRDKI